jgi:hypothetical protein
MKKIVSNLQNKSIEAARKLLPALSRHVTRDKDYENSKFFRFLTFVYQELADSLPYHLLRYTITFMSRLDGLILLRSLFPDATEKVDLVQLSADETIRYYTDISVYSLINSLVHNPSQHVTTSPQVNQLQCIEQALSDPQHRKFPEMILRKVETERYLTEIPVYDTINAFAENVHLHEKFLQPKVDLWRAAWHPKFSVLTPGFSLLADTVEDLDLSEHHISDVSNLASLKKLTYLGLANTRVWNLRPLAGLRELRSLNLSFTPFDVASLEALRDLPHLERIYISAIYDHFKLQHFLDAVNSKRGVLGHIDLHAGDLSWSDLPRGKDEEKEIATFRGFKVIVKPRLGHKAWIVYLTKTGKLTENVQPHVV